MPKYNQDYLKFDAISIQDAITKKLSEDSTFTDQLFPGSNLSIMIDTFSYMFEVLTYYINHSAAEAIFTDTQLYENMNRIVKMLGYNPVGYIPAQTTVSIFDNGTGTRTTAKLLPSYSSINTGLSDAQGKPVYFSTTNTVNIDPVMNQNDTNRIQMVNGRWRLYDTTFTASDQPSQSFTLSLLDMTDEDKPFYIAHPYIDVYVKRNDEWFYFEGVSDSTLFGSSANLIGPQERKFELRLNENKQYVLTFGDGINGSKLQDGDELYIVYLESNGDDGKIGADVINTSTVSWGVAGLDQTTFYEMIDLETDEILTTTELATLTFNNTTASTIPEDLENVDSIRQNAPNISRMGGKLVTAKDYEQFMLQFFASDLYDVYIMNNYQYLSEFQRWVYDINPSLLNIDLKTFYYEYADSCDFNNVYIWIKAKYDNIDKRVIEEQLYPRKSITAEPIILDALNLNFKPCAVNNEYDPINWDSNIENWIEVTKDKNSNVNAAKIKSSVIYEIQKFFDPQYNTLGSTLEIDRLYNSILSIDGVATVRTAYRETGASIKDTQYFDSLSFAAWTKTIVNGNDCSIIKGSLKLKNFQFPVLIDDLNDRVKIVVETFGQPSIEY